MERITSRQNQIVRRLRRLGRDEGYRQEQGEFVGDGVKLLEDALRCGVDVRAVLRSEDCPALPLPDTVQEYLAPGDLVDYASSLKNCPLLFSGIIRSLSAINPKTLLVLEGIQDPGNLGAMARTANALEADALVLVGNCAGLYPPKTLRASMGAVFRQCVYRVERDELPGFLAEKKLKLFGAALSDDAIELSQADLRGAAVAVGSEGQGLSGELQSMCDSLIRIPMNPACQSLNAAAAAAILMWELRRANNG